MTDVDAEATAEPARATHLVVSSCPMGLESLAGVDSTQPIPIETGAIIAQANVVELEFERIASVAVALPAEMGTLLKEGRATSSALRLEISSTVIREEKVHEYHAALKRVLLKGVAMALGNDIGHKILPLTDKLFHVELPKLIALIEHWFN
jgi:hypothetical protein